MIKTLHGRIRGRIIELDEDLEASDGQEVIVQVKMVPAPSRKAGEGSDRRHKVLIVADSATDSHATRTLLEQNGYQVDTATNGIEALGMIAEGRCDIVIADMAMPETDGLDLIRRIKQAFPFLPVFFLTQHCSEELAINALRCGAASYMPKQNLQRDLLPTLRDILLVTQSHQRLAVKLMPVDENPVSYHFRRRVRWCLGAVLLFAVAAGVACWAVGTMKHRADILGRYYLLEGDDLHYIQKTCQETNQAKFQAQEAHRAGWAEGEEYWLRVADWWDQKRRDHEAALPLHSERRVLYEHAVTRPWVRVPADDDPPRRPFLFEHVEHPYGPPPLRTKATADAGGQATDEIK